MNYARNTTRILSLGLVTLALVGCGGGGPANPSGTTGDTTDQASGDAATGSSDDTGETPDATTSSSDTSDPSTGLTGTLITVGDTTDGDTTDSTGGTSNTTGDTIDTTGDTTTGAIDTTDTGDSSTGEACESDARVVKLGKLVDPVDGSVLEGALVVVSGDRIVSVGTDPLDVPCGAEVVDWSAYTGLPGLVDVHTHLIYQTDDAPGTLPWTRSFWLFKNQPAQLAELARKAAERVLELGVTTVIDKGSGPGAPMVAKLRDAIEAGETAGPRIFSAGPGIAGPVASIAALKDMIQKQAATGSDLIKIWADKCSDTHLVCSPTFTFEQLKAGVDEAHALGKSVAIHAYHADTAKLAIMAGPDTLEHPEGMDEVDFMDMNAMDTTYVPTIDHNRYYRDNLAYFGYDPAMFAEFNAYIAENLATTNQAHLAGVKIALGSDAVFSGFGENKGDLGWFIEAGMTPLEALRAATIRGAATIGVDHEIGRVAVDYFADIIVVDGDPLADIDVVLDKVSGVMKGGKVIEP